MPLTHGKCESFARAYSANKCSQSQHFAFIQSPSSLPTPIMKYTTFAIATAVYAASTATVASASPERELWGWDWNPPADNDCYDQDKCHSCLNQCKKHPSSYDTCKYTCDACSGQLCDSKSSSKKKSATKKEPEKPDYKPNHPWVWPPHPDQPWSSSSSSSSSGDSSDALDECKSARKSCKKSCRNNSRRALEAQEEVDANETGDNNTERRLGKKQCIKDCKSEFRSCKDDI